LGKTDAPLKNRKKKKQRFETSQGKKKDQEGKSFGQSIQEPTIETLQVITVNLKKNFGEDRLWEDGKCREVKGPGKRKISGQVKSTSVQADVSRKQKRKKGWPTGLRGHRIGGGGDGNKTKGGG